MNNGFIESTISTPVILPSNSSAISFQNDTRTRSTLGCDSWLCHKENSPIYKLVKPGYYDVSFSATLFSTTEGTVAVGLYEDGILIPSTVRAVNIGADGLQTVAFNKIEKLCCKANSTITVGSVPTITVPITGTVVTTQVPTIYSAIFNITKLS